MEGCTVKQVLGRRRLGDVLKADIYLIYFIYTSIHSKYALNKLVGHHSEHTHKWGKPSKW